MPPKNLENLYPWALPETIPNPFRYGYLGVNLFFIISGFVITQSLEKSGTLIEFWTKRIARIWPSLTIIISALFICGHLYKFDNNSGVDTSLEALFSSLTLIDPRITGSFFSNFTSTTWVSGVLWSLAVEISFYLLISIIFHKIKFVYSKYIFYIFLFIFSFNSIDLLKPDFFASHGTLDAVLILRHYIFWFYIGLVSFGNTKNQKINRFQIGIAFILNLSIESLRHSVKGVLSHLIVSIIIILFHLIFTKKILNIEIAQFPIRVFSKIGDVSYEMYLMHEFFLLMLISAPVLHEFQNFSVLILGLYLPAIYYLSLQIKTRLSDPISHQIRRSLS